MVLPVDIDNGGYRRFGFKLGKKFHNGHDFNCPYQTPVKAILDGQIFFANQKVNGFGGMLPDLPGGVLIIKHNDIMALYGHVRIKEGLKKFDEIKEGEFIGFVDNFFNDGYYLPHLHFAIYQGADITAERWGYVDSLKDWRDPLKYLGVNK